MPILTAETVRGPAERLEPARAVLEDRDLPHAPARHRLERGVVVAADVAGHVRVGGERERRPGVDAHLGERRRRIELVRWLAQPGGRDLDRDSGLGDRLDRRLVVEADVAGRLRAAVPPVLDQVGVREDVVEPGPRRLGEGLEVAAPDPVRVAVAGPDVEVGIVDRAVAEEVDRADDVVEVVRVEHVRDPVLGAGDEVHLDPEPQRGGADEVAVGGQVVDRVFAPERVVPDLERGAEAVDVLGGAELLDPRIARGLEVALGVLLGEVLLGARVRLVRAQVHVVVGEHATERTRLDR